MKKRSTTSVGSERERRRAELQTPMTPSVLASSFDEEVVSEVKAEVKAEKKSVQFESVGGETKAEERFVVEPKGLDPQGTASLRSDVGDLVTDLEDPLLVVGGDRMGLPNIVPLSNAHIELMLVQLVGPKNSDQVVLLMKQVRMEKNPEDINMSLAADYIRRWKAVARWGRRHLPKQKAMIRAFTEGVCPKRLAQSLINEDCKLIEECMTSFLDKFCTWVAAKQTTNSYDDGEPRRTEEKAKPSVKGGTQSESKAKPKTPDTKARDDGKAKAPHYLSSLSGARPYQT